MLIVGGAGVGALALRAAAAMGIEWQSGEAAATVAYRQRLLDRGFEEIGAHPWLGQSVKTLTNTMADLKQGEHVVDFVNSHLFVAMTAGVPLFVAWCLVWLMPVVELWHPRGAMVPLIGGPAAIVVSTMVLLALTSFVDRNFTWPIIALGPAGPCLALARRASRSPAMPNRALFVRSMRPVGPAVPATGAYASE